MRKLNARLTPFNRNDTYLVDNTGDRVIESAVGPTYIGWYGYPYTTPDIDTVNASISYTLGDNVENLNLTGPSTGSGQAALDLSGTGNALNNVSELLDSGAGDDLLTREGGKDLLIAGCIRLWQFKCGAANDAEGRVAA